MSQVVGFTQSDLSLDLNALDGGLQVGQSVHLQLCTLSMPTERDLAEVYVNAVETGMAASYPTARMVDDVPTTDITLTRVPAERGVTGNPALIAIVGIVAPVLTIGLIAYGLTKITDISNAVVPILLVAGGVLVMTVALLRKPAQTYIERGGRIPGMARTRYSPDVTPKYRSTNPPTLLEDAGTTYVIHMTTRTRIEADEEARDLRDHGGKTKVVPWEGGFAIYEYQPILNADLYARAAPTQFCCKFGDACAPAELLEEGSFPKRMAWLRDHYQSAHPGEWGAVQACNEAIAQYHAAATKLGAKKEVPVSLPLMEPGINHLLTSAREEALAALAYRERGEAATKMGDMETAALYQHVAGEEDKHRQQFLYREGIIEQTFLKKYSGKIPFTFDSHGYMAETIEKSGWKDRINGAFQAALAE